MRTASLFIFPVLFLLLSCGNNASTVSEETVDTVETSVSINVRLQEHFPNLFAFYQQQDASFPKAGFEGGELERKDSLISTPIYKSQLLPFRSYLVFNDDSTKAIDFVSYNYVLVNKN